MDHISIHFPSMSTPCFSPKSPENPQAADDLQGEAFGAKVTPWQQVPADEVGKKGGMVRMVGKIGRIWKNPWKSTAFVDLVATCGYMWLQGRFEATERPERTRKSCWT